MEDKGNAKSGRPSGELSRDEVRAQREAKKTAKAVRKGKILDGCSALEAANKNEREDSTVPSPSQPSRLVTDSSVTVVRAFEGSEMTREEVMAQRAEKKKLKEARKSKSASAGPRESQPKALKSSTTPRSTLNIQHPKSQSTDPVTAKVGQRPAIEDSLTETSHAVGKESKSKYEVGGEELDTVDFQSTIQSLFRVKDVETVKDPKFQIHPLFQSLGLKLKNNVIRGTNLRCTSLLNVIKDFVECYQVPTGKSLKHCLLSDLKSNLILLRRQCPLSIGMNNAVDDVNEFLSEMVEGKNDTQQKSGIMDLIDTYIEEKIDKAVEAIVYYGVEKITSGDVIVIFSITEALLELLQAAAEEGLKFEVVFIQTPENKPDIPVILKKLKEPMSKGAVTISSVNFTSAIHRIPHCTKLIIGGHGLFTTGGVMAQSGSAQLALLAGSYNKPAIFLCETYKFCDRSPLDLFTLDEYVPNQSQLDDDLLLEAKIKYDVTPANLVTVVITDIDVLPSTSVPVVLRVQESRPPRKNSEAKS